MIVEEYIEEPEAEESELQTYQAIDPDPPYEDAPDETWSQLGIVAGAVLVLAGVLFFVRKKFSKGQLPTPIQEVRPRSISGLVTSPLYTFRQVELLSKLVKNNCTGRSLKERGLCKSQGEDSSIDGRIVRSYKLLQTLDHRTLQREATQRLNEFADILRNSTNASLSAKNLGDEGAAYVVEGLAFNDRSDLKNINWKCLPESAVCECMTYTFIVY